MLTVKLHRVVLEFVIEYILLIMSYSLVDAVPCILQQYVSFILWKDGNQIKESIYD